jgi:thioesterase domain-containing protein
MRSSSSRLREPIRAALPSIGGAVVQPHAVSYANAGHEVRAEAIQRAADPVNNPNNNNNNNNNNYNIINNNYYYYDMNNNNYHVDEAHQDIISNQEQDDIEEAIRRSLEQI